MRIRSYILGIVALFVLGSSLGEVKAQEATFVVTSILDIADSNPADGICDDGTGKCTLRAAIDEANSNLDSDVIKFDIPGKGPHTILLTSALPAIADLLIIDGTTEPDFSGTPMVVLNGTYAGEDADGLQITAGNSTVRGLVINRFGGSGINLNSSDGNLIEGNFIGTDVTGTIDLGNKVAGVIIGGSSNTIGGMEVGKGNVISGNNFHGVIISGSGATRNLIQGNFIGTDLTGTKALGNAGHGVQISNSAGNTVGGTFTAARNVISGNNIHGIFIVGSTANGNQVMGNLIGTDVTGTTKLSNESGVVISRGSLNTIGGKQVGAGNLISGNNANGVSILSGESTRNTVQGNSIGTQLDGRSPLGNTSHGVIIADNSSDNIIGGPEAGAGNTIAFNGSAGVHIESGARNAILANAIFSNGSLGIDLSPAEFTPNDPGDGDTGPNGLQNFPVLASLFSAPGRISIQGTLSSTANMTFTLEFFSNKTCEPSDKGEGEVVIGSTMVTTEVNGETSFIAAFLDPVLIGSFITATATDANKNTSEFSNCAQIEADLTLADSNFPPDVVAGGDLTYTITVTNKGPSYATGVILTDSSPPEAAFISALPTKGSCSEEEGIVTCGLGTIASGASVDVAIHVTVDPSAKGNIVNTATVTSADPDPDVANNTFTGDAVIKVESDQDNKSDPETTEGTDPLIPYLNPCPHLRPFSAWADYL